MHGSISGCIVFREVHPVSAHNKSLISDTEGVFDKKSQSFAMDVAFAADMVLKLTSTTHSLKGFAGSCGLY